MAIQYFSILIKNLLLVIFGVALHLGVSAQKKQYPDATAPRCFTMEKVQQYLNKNPNARLRSQQALLTTNKHHLNNTFAFRTAGVNDIVNIPVIFHVVLADPYLITDAVIQSQIKALNTDYAGINSDSSNAANFYSVRGHSTVIRFVLAKQTPAGALSNGIERIKSAVASNANLSVDPVKRAALGGADAWDASSYLNIWIGDDASGKNILGYTQFPEAGLPEDDGIFCNYRSIGINACNISSYNKGRTLCHEIGHYFGLFHIWGDEDGCTGDDFRSLATAGSATVLPDSLFNAAGEGNTLNDVGDTPNQAGSSSGCLAGIVTDACSAVAPGKMYQNYMDYTADNCYSMFTKKQVERMEWILLNTRTGLINSIGVIALSGSVKRDASPSESINPGNEANGCYSIINPSYFNCPGSIIPKIRISNNGSDSIRSIKVGLLVNGIAKTPVSIIIPAAGLPFGGTVVVSFPSIALTTGNYELKFYTYSVNGIAIDDVPSNDTLTTAIQVADGVALPAKEDFEHLPFPSNTWSIYNPDGDATWTRVSAGNNSAGAVFIDNFSKNNIGLKDELRTPKFLVAATDSIIISFDLAHKNYPGANDQLSVLVSNNCGASWTTVYAKSGSNLATAGSTTLRYSTPAAADWKSQKITIGGALLSSGKIIIAFQNSGYYGNNIFLDNILIYKQKKLDIAAAAIISPADPECALTIEPQILVSNNGVQSVNGFKAGYILNKASPVYQSFADTILPGASTIITLAPVITTAGINDIKVFTANPFNTLAAGDENTLNDTLNKKFTVNTIVVSPLNEGFEKPAFPPDKWQVVNADTTTKWVQKSPGNNSYFSAFADNFSNNYTGQTTILKSPSIAVAGADSVLVSFDLAYKNFEGASDELTVKVSSDCGASFSSIFDKSGSALATAGSSSSAFLAPVQSDWQTQRIALDSTFSQGNIILAFENISDYGNNIFIDNVKVSALYKRDLAVSSIESPAAAECIGPIVPAITLTNKGLDTITGFTVAYAIDNGLPVSKIVNGIVLAAGQPLKLNLEAFTTSIGPHLLKVYSVNPVTAKGTGDYDHQNDSLTLPFVTTGTQPTLPLAEGFEETVFPAANWGTVNNNDSIKWIKSIAAASTGSSSMVINNFNDTADNTISKLISPVIINDSRNDSVFLSFSLAYQPGTNYPQSTTAPLDTLEIQLSKDCGITTQTVWKTWGAALQTVNNANYPSFSAFTPLKKDWKNISCYLSPFAGNTNFQLYFIAKSNRQNNIWLDDIQIYAKQLPKKLKEQGYLIYPNPFANSFLIHHLGAPLKLKATQVFDESGRLVYDQHYNGNAVSEITVKLTGKAAGVYVLKMIYSDKTIIQKLVKR